MMRSTKTRSLVQSLGTLAGLGAMTAALVLGSGLLLPGPRAEEPLPAQGAQAPAEGAPAEGAEAPAEPPVPVKRVNFYAENWSFDPKEIRVRQGTKVVLNFTSVDADHSFVIKKGYKIKVPLPEGSKKKFEFVADKAGKFTYFCGRPCGNGCPKMYGKLIVVPDEG